MHSQKHTDPPPPPPPQPSNTQGQPFPLAVTYYTTYSLSPFCPIQNLLYEPALLKMEGRRRKRWTRGRSGIVKWMFCCLQRKKKNPQHPLLSPRLWFSEVSFPWINPKSLVVPTLESVQEEELDTWTQQEPTVFETWRLEGLLQIRSFKCLFYHMASFFALFLVFGVEPWEKPKNYRTRGPVKD